MVFDVVETLGAVEKQVAHLVFKAAEAPTGSLSKLLGGDQKLRGGGSEELEGRADVVCPSAWHNTHGTTLLMVHLKKTCLRWMLNCHV